MTDETDREVRIAIVGPCASGKSTLRRALAAAGYRHVANPAQEHSYVADMWRRIARPEVLIYLDVDYVTARTRRPGEDRGEAGVAEQKRRLAHARQHADLIIDTNGLTPPQVTARTLSFLKKAAKT